MIKNIIFITPFPFSQRDYERFGVDILKCNHLDVKIFDISAFMSFVSPDSSSKCIRNIDGYSCFNNKREVLQDIQKLGKEDFVIILEHYNRKNYFLYQGLSAANVNYGVFIANTLPLSAKVGKKTSALLNKISRITPDKLLNFILNFPFRPAFFRYLGIKPARLCFAGGEMSLTNHAGYFPVDRSTQILWLHSFDYDLYLKHNGNSTAAKKTKAVFLDLGVPAFHGDDDTGKRKQSLTKQRYYPALCRFFDKIEKECNVHIEIAAHPRSSHAGNPDYFGGRPTIIGKTCEMVRDTVFVIAHGSTAVAFAVLFEKPVIFITTDELERGINSESLHLKIMAEYLGKIPLNIDHLSSVDWQEQLKVNKALYNDYRNLFIKKDGTADILLWQQVAEKLRTLADEKKA